MSDSAQLELQRMIEARLARFGAVGSVSIDAGLLKLEGGGPSACVPIELLLARWDRLAFAERESECALLAGALQRQRRAPPSTPTRRGIVPWGWLAIGTGLLVAAGALRRNLVNALAGPSVAAQRAVSSSVPLDTDAERKRHAATVCDATRSRLARGGLVGGSDVEGWVVELSLVEAVPGAKWPSLDGFLSPSDARSSRIDWRGSPELSSIQGGETRVEVTDAQWPEQEPRFRERRFTFLGGYVLPYFREREQIQFVRLGHALAERHGASLAALYARCEHDGERHMGSWFLGGSPGAAAAALLFFMGAQAVPAQLPHDVLSSRVDTPFEPAFALQNLLGGTERLKRHDLIELLGAQSGTVASSGEVTTLAFPFVESDRALFASGTFARLFEAPVSEPSSAHRKRAAR